MRRRKAVSLVEFMLFTFLALLILGAIWFLMRRGMSLQDSTAKSIDMMVQARAVIEYFSRDARLAITFLPPSQEKEVVIIQDALDVHVNKLKINDWKNNAYPFYNHKSENKQLSPAIRTRYVYDQEKRTLKRIRELGVLEVSDSSQDRGYAAGRRFIPASDAGKKERVLATDLVRFDVEHITIDRRGKPRHINSLKPEDLYLESWLGQEQCIRYAQTAMLFLHLTTRFDKGLYGLDPDNPQRGKDRKAEEVDIVTKVVCLKKSIDATEREWFSSADDDMRY